MIKVNKGIFKKKKKKIMMNNKKEKKNVFMKFSKIMTINKNKINIVMNCIKNVRLNNNFRIKNNYNLV
jgi:hypothetical protein